MTISIAKLCRYAECRFLFIIMLSVIMLNVVMLSVMAPTFSIAFLHYVIDVFLNGLS
jgi:hypothetical protein